MKSQAQIEAAIEAQFVLLDSILHGMMGIVQRDTFSVAFEAWNAPAPQEDVPPQAEERCAFCGTTERQHYPNALPPHLEPGQRITNVHSFIPASAQVAQEGGDEPNENGQRIPVVNVTEAAEGVAASRTTQEIIERTRRVACSVDDFGKHNSISEVLYEAASGLEEQEAHIAELEKANATLHRILLLVPDGEGHVAVRIGEMVAENESLRKTMERVREILNGIKFALGADDNRDFFMEEVLKDLDAALSDSTKEKNP